ncbi:Hpt domain-containing protein [Sulfitobacter pacificus]|uniref:Hpt domain-containing protein n=1 Tax=Sulfitobacter pacificus TaxID=1499314 RepID=UPI00361FF71A
MSTDNDPMAEIRASFFIECEELLEALQDGLQTMDDEGSDDPETINVVFRAVHSIKGGAGAFGLEGLVRFAHRYETVLDEVRAGRLSVDAAALKVFFQAADHLSDLVRVSRDDDDLPVAETARLLTDLDAFLGGPPEQEDEQEIEFQPMVLSLDLDLGDGEDSASEGAQPDLDALPPLPDFGSDAPYRIVFTPHVELFDTGNEPALLLRNLMELGEVSVVCDASALPELAKITPDIPHLSWVVTLYSTVDESEIRSVFEFVDGLCQLDISRGEETSPAPRISRICQPLWRCPQQRKRPCPRPLLPPRRMILRRVAAPIRHPPGKSRSRSGETCRKGQPSTKQRTGKIRRSG